MKNIELLSLILLIRELMGLKELIVKMMPFFGKVKILIIFLLSLKMGFWLF